MLVIIAVIVIVAIVLSSLALQQRSPAARLADFYQRQEKLFSAAERSFFGVLQQACGNDYVILCKVRVVDVITGRPTKNCALWQKSFNRVCSKHFDLVLCDKNDLSVQCVIELDAKSHQKSKRQQRDQFLDELCQAVRLPLVRFAVKHSYIVSKVIRWGREKQACSRCDCILSAPVPSRPITLFTASFG